MNSFYDICPRCKSSKGLGKIWIAQQGRELRTCFRLNQPEHLGYKFHFYTDTGDPLTAVDGPSSRILAMLAAGEPRSLRGVPGPFLRNKCLVSVIEAAELDHITASTNPNLGLWARQMERNGLVIALVPIMVGSRMVGVQLRAFEPEDDTCKAVHEFRTFGSAEGLFIPVYKGWNPSAVVIHEGPWGAIAAMWEADEYVSAEIFSVAILSASTSAAAVTSTLDLIFPGVPRFSLTDQDPAGVAAREALLPVARPLLVTGAGPGKDYRDLIPGLRFERLSEAVRAALKRLDERQ